MLYKTIQTAMQVQNENKYRWSGQSVQFRVNAGIYGQNHFIYRQPYLFLSH